MKFCGHKLTKKFTATSLILIASEHYYYGLYALIQLQYTHNWAATCARSSHFSPLATQRHRRRNISKSLSRTAHATHAGTAVMCFQCSASLTLPYTLCHQASMSGTRSFVFHRSLLCFQSCQLQNSLQEQQ